MSMKNMAVMFGAMALMRRIDQEEPLVLMYARIFYVSYIAVTTFIYLFVHHRIVSRRDMSTITVPISPPAPSMSDALAAAKSDADADPVEKDESEEKADGKAEAEQGEADKAPKEEVITVMEYDLRQLAAARSAWIKSACFLAAIHYKMESVSPLIMSSLMGFTRMISEDTLFQIHVRGAPAVGDLQRPFVVPKNPLADMLKDMAPKPEGVDARGTAQSGTAQPEEDLHDDGDADDVDDTPPPAIGDLKDDHIKSDFDDDEEEDNDDDANRELKKTQ